MSGTKNIVLGLSSGHDAGAAIVVDGRLIAAASEERFKRMKHYVGFPDESIKFVAGEAGIDIKDIKYVARGGVNSTVFTLRNINEYVGLPRGSFFARLLKSYSFLPDFLKSSYAVKKKEVFGVEADEAKMLEDMGMDARCFFVDHHLGHASYSYYASGCEDALAITLDGAGHGLSGTVYECRKGQMRKIAETYTQGHSLGYFYAILTDGLGFEACNEEWKVMGLAAFGKSNKSYDELRRICPAANGLNLKARSVLTGWSRNIVNNRLRIYFNDSARVRLLAARHGREDVAMSGQAVCEEEILKLVENAVKKTGLADLVGGGGVFLNIKANKRILESGLVKSLFVPPGPGDGSLPAGYALEVYRRLNPGQMIYDLPDAYLGPCFNDSQIESSLRKRKGIVYEKPADFTETVAGLLMQGNVIGWFQGKMEWGPRALGSRSVLADPRNPEIKDRINSRLKMRDPFMPFGPSVLAEHCDEYFENFSPSPFMNKSFKIKPEYIDRVPAVVHVDGTVRPHIVDENVNPLYYRAIHAFFEKSGVPMVLNTSFNKHGLPIVCTPEDALDHLSWGCVDALAMGDFIVRRA